MIKTLNYIVGLAVLLVAFGIPLRIYLLNAEERDREQMLEDLGALPSETGAGSSVPSSPGDPDRLQESKETLRNLSTVGKSLDALNDLMPQTGTPSTSHGNQSKLLDLSNVPDSTMIDLLKQLESDLPAYLSSPQGVLQDGITDDPEAMDRYLKTLEQDPANHKAIYDLAIRYLESGDVDQAGKLAYQLKQYDQSMAGNLRELIKKVRRDE